MAGTWRWRSRAIGGIKVMRAFAAFLTAIMSPISAAQTAVPAMTEQAEQADRGKFITLDPIATALIAPPRVMVWLPPRYDAEKRRYGVVYMHDGQRLFDPERNKPKQTWEVDEAALRVIAAKQTAPFIIVAIDNPGKDRQRQFMPQTIYNEVSPAVKTKLDSFMGGSVTSDQYLKFLVTELKPIIDSKFRTKKDANHTAIMGSSMGGLISFYAIASYPKVFGVAGVVSPHYPLGDPFWNDSDRKDIFAAWGRFVSQSLGKPKKRRIWFDHGDITLDYFYGPYQQSLNGHLVTAGWKPDVDFSSKLFKKTKHTYADWAARLDETYRWMLKDWQ